MDELLKQKLEKMNLSDLHQESIATANRLIQRFPNSWKEEVRKDKKSKYIKQLINERKGKTSRYRQILT